MDIASVIYFKRFFFCFNSNDNIRINKNTSFDDSKPEKSILNIRYKTRAYIGKIFSNLFLKEPISNIFDNGNSTQINKLLKYLEFKSNNSDKQKRMIDGRTIIDIFLTINLFESIIEPLGLCRVKPLI